MSWLTVIWSMSASACLTLGVVYAIIWAKQRRDRYHLLFSIAAVSIAGVAFGELGMMRAQNVHEFGVALRWTHLPLGIMIISLVGFVRLYLRSGRRWLAWGIVGLRVLALIINFSVWPNLNYREITSLKHVPIIGTETASVAIGIPGIWTHIGQLGSLSFAVFVTDASIQAWRRGNPRMRRRAVLVGGSLTFAVLFSFFQANLVLHDIVRAPYLISLPFLVPMFVMAYQLGSDVVRSAQLSRELDASRDKLRRVERDASQRRNELAFLSRVTILGELSGSLAHELNQPLTAILSNAQAAQRFIDNDPIDRQEVKEILKDIIAADNRAGETIHRLRLLFKSGEVTNQPVNLNALVMDVLKFLGSDLMNREVKASTDLKDAMPRVRADPVQIQQVLINLVVNACDAMSGKKNGDRQILLSSEASNGDVRVRIRDCGCGIAEDQLEKVFEPFITTKSNGMGLGLSVCRTIVDAHGGKLWATNNADLGATFHLTLPALHETAV
jgi:signal transduction histidine kinase